MRYFVCHTTRLNIDFKVGVMQRCWGLLLFSLFGFVETALAESAVAEIAACCVKFNGGVHRICLGTNQ
jgi:hypothetical protein